MSIYMYILHIYLYIYANVYFYFILLFMERLDYLHVRKITETLFLFEYTIR